MTPRMRRGAAVVELALITPLLVAALVAGQWLTEIALVRLELREAARFAAWEVAGLPSHSPDATRPDYRAALAHAQRAASGRSLLRDGLGDRLPNLHLAGGDAFAVDVEESAFEPVGTFRGVLDAEGEGTAARLSARIERDPGSGVAAFGFAPRGRIQATAAAALRWRGHRSLRVAEHVEVISGEWAERDGRDVVARDGRSGVHPDGTRSGLWHRVDRGKWLGGEDLTREATQSAFAVLGVLPVAAPDVDGTYVVSLRAGGRAAPGACPDLPNFPRHGLSAVADLRPILDDPSAACFGTQPLRDTHEYAASLPLQALRERGEHFMGCVSAQADDPTRSVDEDLSDSSTAKVHCGGRVLGGGR